MRAFLAAWGPALLWALLALNVLAFSLMGFDKRRSRRGGRRVRERTLLLLGLFGGALGGCLGMRAFHHKTLHPQFRYGLPLMRELERICLLRCAPAGRLGSPGRRPRTPPAGRRARPSPRR